MPLTNVIARVSVVARAPTRGNAANASSSSSSSSSVRSSRGGARGVRRERHVCESTRARRVLVRADADGDDAASPSASTTPTTTDDLGLKAAWYGAEAFGKVIGGGDAKSASASASASAPPTSREAALASIRADYDEDYFVSGRGTLSAYAPDCVFADPFVSFAGVDRFKQNVGNLGGLMREIDLNVTGFTETNEGLQTEWRFTCILDLPWRPRLSAKGGTTHVIDKTTNLVVRHYERWDVEPAKVLKQLFVPASKVPESQAEVFMMSATSGDVVGALGAIAPVLLKVSAPLWLTSAALRGVTHSESTGIENAFGWFFTLALIGQVAKFLRGVGMS